VEGGGEEPKGVLEEEFALGRAEGEFKTFKTFKNVVKPVTDIQKDAHR